MRKADTIRAWIIIAGCTLLLAGCLRYDIPSQSGEIGFHAESALLPDGVTRARIIEGTVFPEDSAFSVFGTRNTGSSESVVFGGEHGVTVRKSSGTFDYQPHRFWVWESSTDYYDFVAVSPDGKSVKMDTPGTLAVTTHYDIADDNYDLMTAAYRRKGSVQNPCSEVPMAFSHMNSAVRIVVINNSETASVTLQSYKYKNLMVVGDAKVTLDLYGNPVTSWINMERNTNDVRITDLEDQAVAAGDSLVIDYDLMLPQRLNQAVGAGGLEENMPRLILTYTPSGGVESTADIGLKDVTRQDGTAITEWETGKRYIYYVSMRLDGGVLVRIVTTAWTPIEAETPGLLI